MAATTQHFALPDNSGCKLAYRTLSPSSASSASSIPLLLVNGLSAVMDDWSPLFEALARTRTVVISDHRGIGESTVSDEWDQTLTAESMGLDVIALARHLGYSTIDLLGFSMGGFITQALLSADFATVDHDGLVVVEGVRIRKAVLTATTTKLPRGDVDFNALNQQAAKIKDKVERNNFITYNMMALQYHPEVIGAGKPLDAKFQQRLKVVRSTSRPAPIIALQFLAMQSTDLRKQLHRIPSTVPIMVIHGHKDRMVRYDESDHILKGIQHAQRLQGTPSTDFGHFWYDYFDNIDLWAGSIVNFLDYGKVAVQAKESKL